MSSLHQYCGTAACQNRVAEVEKFNGSSIHAVVQVADVEPVFCSTDESIHLPNTCDGDSQARISMAGKEDENHLIVVQCSNQQPHSKESPCSQNWDYLGYIDQVQVYLDKVKDMMRPGCSADLLNFALNSVSSLAGRLSTMPLEQYPRASL